MAVRAMLVRLRETTRELNRSADWLMKGMTLLLTSYETNLEKEAILGTLVRALAAKEKSTKVLADEELPTEIRMPLAAASVKALPLRKSRSSRAGVKSGKAAVSSPVQRTMESSLRSVKVLAGRVAMEATFNVSTMRSESRTVNPVRKERLVWATRSQS